MTFIKVTRTIMITAAITSAVFSNTVMAADLNEKTIEITRVLDRPKEPTTILTVVQAPMVAVENIDEEMLASQQAAAEEAAVQEAAARAHSYTEEDLYILAHVICGEAQSSSDEEQRYVGSVVLNRVNHGKYPNTIKGVVFQKNQYSCTRDGNYYRTPTERNWANARYLLENGSVLPGNVVFQSGARQGKGVYVKTASHYYCY